MNNYNDCFSQVMGFEESFLYPLGLLGIGSLISMFLIPRFTDSYSKKRHELEIKKDLIIKITELDAEWHIVLDDIAIPVEEKDENARTLTKILGELEKKESVIQSLLNLYFSNESLHSKWEKYSQSHPMYSDYLYKREEKDLMSLSELLADDKIKTATVEKLDETVEKRIEIIFEEILKIIEKSKIRKLNS